MKSACFIIAILAFAFVAMFIAGCEAAPSSTVGTGPRKDSESDRAALVDLYTATQGTSWLNNRDWWRIRSGLHQDLEDLYGVLVAYDDYNVARVTELYLSSNNLVGRIPHSLTRLDKLQTLDLGGNHLSGCIPAALLRVPDNDLHLLDLPFCETPPDYTPVSESGSVSVPQSESAPCPPGEPCVAIHGDKTKTAVGEAIVLTFAAVNDIALPELTAQMVIAIPSGWVANSAEWTDACTALCNITLKIPTGDNRTTRIEIYPNESGDFSMRATLRWFAGEEAEANVNQRDEIINVRVN